MDELGEGRHMGTDSADSHSSSESDTDGSVDHEGTPTDGQGSSGSENMTDILRSLVSKGL